MSKNDELLCRAKQKGTDDWVEGYYCKYERTNPDGSVNTTHLIVPYYASALYGIEVDPATVGRCTGLTDKNGKKIFERDILRSVVYSSSNEYPFSTEEGSASYYGVIKRHKENSAFIIVTRQRRNSPVNGISDGEWDYIREYAMKGFEVIGNIHDNPELLRNNA